MIGRKIMFSLVLILFSSSFISAQEALKKGGYYLSGSLSFNSVRNKHTINSYSGEIKTTRFHLQPSFSYFLIDRLSIGADINFQYDENKSSYSDEYRESIGREYGIGPNIRYYFNGCTLIPFIGASASYMKTDYWMLQEGNTLSISAGLDYFVSDNAALEPFFSFTRSSYKDAQVITAMFVGFRTNYFIIN